MAHVVAAPVGLGAALREDEVATLGAGGVVVRDGVLGRAAAIACRDEVLRHAAGGALTPAAMGRDRAWRPELRGDHTAWMTEVDRGPALQRLWMGFERLRRGVNRACWLGLRRFEVQLAWYPGDGARYVRHVDAFAGSPSRRLTAIVYLNDGWRPEHGGVLRTEVPEGVRDVAPELDRLVLFLSDRVFHEVLPCHASRVAVTAWYRGAEEIPLLPDPRALGLAR